MSYLCKAKWGDLDFPPPFGRDALPEVSVVVVLDVYGPQLLIHDKVAVTLAKADKMLKEIVLIFH